MSRVYPRRMYYYLSFSWEGGRGGAFYAVYFSYILFVRGHQVHF